MEFIDFYTIDPAYIRFLKNAEILHRGFTRVPDVVYSPDRKQKFLLGAVLDNTDIYYFVPVSSYDRQQADNFLLRANDGHVVGSLRFNYMIPVPREVLSQREIFTEPDPAYRSLLSQELRFCIRNKKIIFSKAQETYERVISGQFPQLSKYSCDFLFLEEKCREYTKQLEQSVSEKVQEAPAKPRKMTRAEVMEYMFGEAWWELASMPEQEQSYQQSNELTL